MLNSKSDVRRCFLLLGSAFPDRDFGQMNKYKNQIIREAYPGALWRNTAERLPYSVAYDYVQTEYGRAPVPVPEEAIPDRLRLYNQSYCGEFFPLESQPNTRRRKYGLYGFYMLVQELPPIPIL